jgi:uncharacterized membrane-anchored protein
MNLLKRIALISLFLSCCAARADITEERRKEIEASFQAAAKVLVRGPSDVKLGEWAHLQLPAGMGWIPQPEAGRMMQAMGNSTDKNLLGLVRPIDGQSSWLVVAEYVDSGYIKDDDARDWKVDELFKNLKEGTEAANQRRREQGFPELDIVGWLERPAYDAQTHRLVWAMEARQKGAAAGEDSSVNYNTYALGREGFMSLNLVTERSTVGQDKSAAQTLLAALEFNSGKRYADYNASTDRTAEYGLAALVAGVAAKKLGLFALGAAFFAKFAKIILLALAGLGAGFMKFFKRRT